MGTLVCLRCNQAPRQIGSSFCDDCREAITSGRPFEAKVSGRVQTVRLPVERPKAPEESPPAKGPRGCDVEGCPEPHMAKGLCDRHYKQDRRGKVPRLRPCFFCMPGSGDRPLCAACRAELDGLRAYLRTRCSTLVPL